MSPDPIKQTPEASTVQNAENTVEATPAVEQTPEQLVSSTSIPQSTDDDTKLADVEHVISSSGTEDQPAVVSNISDDMTELEGDSQYIDEVKRIIHDDKDKPFQEQEESEALQKDYLGKRFGMKIDKDGGN